MPDDPFFTAVVLQLIRAPQPSRDALAAAQRRAPAIPPELAFEVNSARGWALTLLQPTFQPRVNERFVAFPAEEGRFDVIRCAYQADGLEILIGESKYVISVRVAGARLNGRQSDREKAEAVARTLLQMPDRIRFKELGTFDTGHYGRQDTAVAGRIDPNWPHWLDAMRWWSEDGAVGFVTLKASGGPTRAVISVADQSNRYWF